MVTSATKLILSEFQLSVSVRKPWRLWWHRDGNDYSVMMWPHCLTMFLYSAILRWPMSTLTTSKSFYLNRVTTLFVIGYVMGIPISCSLSLLSGLINKPVALHSFKINDVVYTLWTSSASHQGEWQGHRERLLPRHPLVRGSLRHWPQQGQERQLCLWRRCAQVG